MAGYSSAQFVAISTGVDWFIANQNADKSWGGITSSVTPFNATAAAVSALKICGNTGSAANDGLNWLNGQTPDSVNFAAERLLTNAIAGLDTTSDLNQLISWKNNIDGSWGLDGEYSNDIVEVAITLQALHAANYANYSNLFQAVNFLTTTQNSDGGWGASAGDASSTYVTAFALKALNVYSSVFINQNSINKASAFLLAHQNIDGGFGDSPSTVYATALSIMSLIESGQGSTQTILNGINYLASTQAADGSWNDDPYSTALALQALAEARPNLAVSSSGITLSNAMPQSGVTTTISAVISNTGYDSASNVIVRFYLGDPSAGGTPLGTDQIIPFIALGSSAQASISAPFTGTGGKTIFVVADPDNLISETSKADNKASARIWVATGPDLTVYSEELLPSTYVPTTGTPFTLNYTVRNLGESAASGFDIALYDGDPSTVSGHLLSTANVSGINGSDMRTGTLGVTLTTNGNHTLYLVADSGNQITEISKTNNTGNVTVNVGGTQTLADLAVASQDITLTPSRPHAGDTVYISANVHNIGADVANNFTVEIFDGQPEAGGTLLAVQTISLVAGGSQVVSTNWPIPGGIHDIVVVLDRTNQIAETNESNNRAVARLMTDMIDITISATDLVFTPSHPVNGDSVVLSITAHNTGIKDTGPFNLALYDGDPAAGGTLLQTFPISNVPGEGSNVVSHVFTAIPWTYRFYAVADSENVVTELYDDNNTAIRSLKIKAPGETLGSDLVPTKIDLMDTTTDPQTLVISGNAHVTFQNTGDDKITTSFNVLIFEDMDLDSRYTSGVDNLLSSGTNTLPLWPEGAGRVSVPLSGAVKFLHSPLYAFIDSGDAIMEQDETNNLIVSCTACEVRPTNPIQPVVKWRYNRSTAGAYGPLVVAPFIDTSGDGKIDENDVPAIILNASPGIVALRGDTGQEIFTIDGSNPNGAIGSAFITTGDIDNDGSNEIVVTRQSYLNTSPGIGILAYDRNGALKWDNKDKAAGYNFGNLSNVQVALNTADIDNDGKPEIIMGSAVFNGDGSVKWVQPTNYGYYGSYGATVSTLSTVVDLDLDGRMEILFANRAFNSDGTIRWRNSTLNDGISVIAKFDDDPYPNIVYAVSRPPTGDNTLDSGALIYLLDHTGRIKWGPVTMRTFEPLASRPDGSVPVIADVDGDGQPEIVIRTATKIIILDKSGILKRAISVPDNCSPWYYDRSTAPTVFDLNGDNRPEIIINSKGYFRIYDGKEGTLQFEDADNIYCRDDDYQRTIVSDVDGDGHAEIVVAGVHNTNLTVPGDLVRVYKAKNNDWVGSRKIWNQPNYHVTNVNDDGSIPQFESPSWLMNNTYICQAAVAPISNPYLTPNLTASYLRIDQAGAAINLAVRVGNGGAIASGPTVTVTFYDDDPASGGMVIGTAATTRALNPGDYQDVIYSWTGGSLGLHHIYAVVDAANAISECRKDDNKVSADFTIQVEYADLKIGQEDIVIPAGPYYEGIPVSITTNVKNIGALPASNVLVRMYNGNPSTGSGQVPGGVQIGNDQVIPSINAGSSVQLVFDYDTLGKTGTNVLYVVVDPANTIAEASKTNNTASISIQVQPAVLPDLTISSADIQLTPASPREGDNLTVAATVHNLGTATGNIPVRIAVWSSEFGVGSEVYGETKTIYPVLNLGGTTTVTTTIDTTGLTGQLSVVATIDSANTITESRKDNNSASEPFFVQSAGLNASIAVDKPAYNAEDTVTGTITAINATGVSRSLSLGLFVQDSAGNTIATISTADSVTVGSNGSTTLGRTWNTGTTLAGQYTVISALSESGRVISRKSAGFTIAPDTRINATVTTDKISYNPNETAALTATVTSQSKNYIYSNITAQIVVTGGTGTIFTDTRNITTLMPGATFTFKDYWNTGAFASGTYPVTLTVRDSTNAIIATGTQNLTISTIVKPTAVLRGTISVSSQELLTGDTTTVSYTVTNIGNIDLQNIALTVLTVNVSDQTVNNTFTYPATLAMGGAVSNTLPITTADYTAKDYLVVLRANIAGTEETLAGTSFRIEGAPSAPSLSLPADGSDIETFTPQLVVNNASDPNDDKLTYEFEVYSDSGLTSLVTGSSGQGTTWTVPVDLTENQAYFWRCRAFDDWLYGPWMQAAFFRVNTVNDPPTAPTVSSPADNGAVDTLLPVLAVNNASDPDSSSLTYNFDIALDPDFISIVTTTLGVTTGPSTGSGGFTSWQVTSSLTENTTYYWRCQADDWLITGPWMTTASFFVNTANDAPSKPVIIAPLKDSEVAALSTDITISNSADPDSPALTYVFEADTVPTFDSPGIIRSGPSTGPGQVTTTWHVTGLQDNTQYYVRARANDGQTDGPWSDYINFFVNMANDPPATPTLANPSNGAGVTVLTPTLSIHDATDPDRDVLTYDFEVYSDAALTTIVTATSGVSSQESGEITSWTVPESLTENQTYYWRARANDGMLASDWMPSASFMVNTANDAPGAPTLFSPLEGSSVATLNPTLAVTNAVDPDSTNLTYTFEVYLGTTPVTSVSDVPAGNSGVTSIMLASALQDNTVYQWRARAYDGDCYGAWTAMGTFTVHVSQMNVNATIDFDPNTLNKMSNGNWVVVYIELPVGYNVADIDISSIRLETTIPAELRPYAIGDHDKDGIPDLMVKFKRSDVINLLPNGEQVTVHVTGRVGVTTLDGVDIIRVMK